MTILKENNLTKPCWSPSTRKAANLGWKVIKKVVATAESIFTNCIIKP